jgi:hypothetical protein
MNAYSKKIQPFQFAGDYFVVLKNSRMISSSHPSISMDSN